MNYEKQYQDFYSKYYDKTELLVKAFFIKRKNQKRTFTNSLNEVSNYLNSKIINKNYLYQNEELQKLYQLFCKRYTFYETDQIQEILASDIKFAFDKIKSTELSTNYTYKRLISDIATVEVASEISRLVSNNYRLLEMFYKLNEFDGFEIREHKNLDIDDLPIFIKLHSKLYPHHYNETTTQPVATNATGLGIAVEVEKENWFPSLFLNSEVYNCFMDYQKHIIDFYTDYSYLKKRMEKEKLIHYHKDNDFMKIMYEDVKLISERNYRDYCINGKLKSLEKSYNVQRENNFNIIFDSLL